MTAVPITSNVWSHADEVLKYVVQSYRFAGQYFDMEDYVPDNAGGPRVHWTVTDVKYAGDPPVEVSPVDVTGKVGYVAHGGIDWTSASGGTVLTFGQLYHARYAKETEYPGLPATFIYQNGKRVAELASSIEAGGIRGCCKLKGRYIVAASDSQSGSSSNITIYASYLNYDNPDLQWYPWRIHGWKEIGRYPVSQGITYGFCHFNPEGTQFVATVYRSDSPEGETNIMTGTITYPDNPEDFPDPDSADRTHG